MRSLLNGLGAGSTPSNPSGSPAALAQTPQVADLQRQIAQLKGVLARLGVQPQSQPQRGYTSAPRDSFERSKKALTNLGTDAPPSATPRGPSLAILARALGMNPKDLGSQLERGGYLPQVAADQGLSPKEALSSIKSSVSQTYPQASDAMVSNIARRLAEGQLPTASASAGLPSIVRGKTINPSTARGALRLGIPREIPV